jgi:4,5:9,10-diseco-3-hydroxy-5,9,17-trioxoandrosta-1(10),2-diene-4-oate hydrolase
MALPELLEHDVKLDDDLTLHYAECGSGDPVICLHGTGPGSSGVSSYAPNLADISKKFHTFVPDLPRFGKSSKVKITAPRLDYMSSAVRRFMDAVGIDRAHLVGNSMGAQTALKLAIDTPERVGRLVLMAPAAVGFSLHTPMPTEAVRLISRYYDGPGPSRERMRELLLRMVYDPAYLTDEVVEERYRASIDPETIEANSIGPWARQSLEGELERCTAPTLLVWGHDDRATPFDTALLLMKKLPDARLHVFQRCGHWANVERAAEFNASVVDFLGRA